MVVERSSFFIKSVPSAPQGPLMSTGLASLARRSNLPIWAVCGLKAWEIYTASPGPPLPVSSLENSDAALALDQCREELSILAICPAQESGPPTAEASCRDSSVTADLWPRAVGSLVGAIGAGCLKSVARWLCLCRRRNAASEGESEATSHAGHARGPSGSAWAEPSVPRRSRRGSGGMVV